MLDWSWSEGGGVYGPASGQVAHQGAESAAEGRAGPGPSPADGESDGRTGARRVLGPRTVRVRSRAETTDSETVLSDSISRIGPAFCKVLRLPPGRFNRCSFSYALFVIAGLNSTAWNDPLLYFSILMTP